VTNCSERQIGKLWRWAHRTSETSAPLYRSTRSHIPEDRSVNIHCREKYKYDNFRVSKWRHFVAFCSHSIIREKVSRRATKSLTRKPRDFLNGWVRHTRFVYGHHTIAERVCQAQNVCFMNTIWSVKWCVRLRMCASWTPYDLWCVRLRMCASWTPFDWLKGCLKQIMYVSWKWYDFWKGVSGKKCVFLEYHTTSCKGVSGTECFMNSIRPV